MVTHLSIFQAAGIHGVTLKSPPKGDHFSVFHGQAAYTSANNSIALPPPAMASPMTPHSYGGYGWHPAFGMMPSAPVPVPATPFQALTPQPAPSSNPPDNTAVNPYPFITNFINDLALQHSLHNLDGVAVAFATNDYLYIDEILSFSKDKLMGSGFHLSGGNAKFILERVDYEMRRTERAKGMKRR